MGTNYEDEEEEELSFEFKAFLMTFEKFVENAKSKEEVVDFIKKLINEAED